MSDGAFPELASAEIPSTDQKLFVRYFTAVLTDLVVLNLFDEYWEHVNIDSFLVSLLTAIILQVLLKMTLALEHRVAEFFSARPGGRAKFMRYFSAWMILFGSKFVMLGAIGFAFGDDVYFGGPLHGVLAFIVVVIVMLIAEEIVTRFYRRLS